MSYEFGFSDEYIANALKKDARDSSIQYSKIGLEAFLPQKAGPTSKPNTRFLRNILLETDSHNAALLAKEREEAQIRRTNSKSTTKQERTVRSHKHVSRSDEPRQKRRRVEERHNGDDDYSDRGGGGVAKRISTNANDSYESGAVSKNQKSNNRGHKDCTSRTAHADAKRRSHSEKRYRKSSRGSSEEAHTDRRRSTHHARSRYETTPSYHEVDKERGNRDQVHEHRRSSRSTPISDTESAGLGRRTSRRDRHKHRSTSSKHSTSSEKRNYRESRKQKHREELDDVKFLKVKANDEQAESSDSDPLDSIIGPQPAENERNIRMRGRGTFGEGSGVISSHFSSAYDPKVDIKPGSDVVDDWDQALEALRDRQHWAKQGAERLRSAGFSENEISKWEKGGKKDESDVRWKPAGEGREWDRGKVVNNDGHVELKPTWDRLDCS